MKKLLNSIKNNAKDTISTEIALKVKTSKQFLSIIDRQSVPKPYLPNVMIFGDVEKENKDIGSNLKESIEDCREHYINECNIDILEIPKEVKSLYRDEHIIRLLCLYVPYADYCSDHFNIIDNTDTLIDFIETTFMTISDMVYKDLMDCYTEACNNPNKEITYPDIFGHIHGLVKEINGLRIYPTDMRELLLGILREMGYLYYNNKFMKLESYDKLIECVEYLRVNADKLPHQEFLDYIYKNFR